MDAETCSQCGCTEHPCACSAEIHKDGVVGINRSEKPWKVTREAAFPSPHATYTAGIITWPSVVASPASRPTP